MYGKTRTKPEKAFHNDVAALGCIACRIDGIRNSHVSIHHTDGRTKPGSHRKVLPLCAPHHQQDDTDQAKRQSIHGNPGAFHDRYGTNEELLAMTFELLGYE